MSVNSLELAARTHVGRVRHHNEDSHAFNANLGMFVLADGMGGHRAGEVASRVAVDAATEYLERIQKENEVDELESLYYAGQATQYANDAIILAVDEDPALHGMGTTLVVAMFRYGRIFYSHVGDSRLYRWRDGDFRQLTRDHSLIQKMVDTGLFPSIEDARLAGVGDNVLTRSLGLSPDVEIDVGDQSLQAGDIYLSCSDGLSGPVHDDTMARILEDTDGDLDLAADALVQLALDGGGHDNITLILARPLLNSA